MSDKLREPFWKRMPILVAYSSAIVVGGLAQLALGSDSGVVAMAVAAALISVVPAFVFGPQDMVALITLSVGARFAASAIAWRLLIGQRVDLGLYDPHESFFVILCGVSAVAMAAFVSHLVYSWKPLFRENYTPTGVSFLVWVAIAFTLSGVVIVSRGAQVLGGVSSIAGTGITFLPIAWMGYNLARGRPVFSPPMLAMVLGLSILGLGSNSRTGVLQPFVGVVFFVICFHIPVSRKALVTSVVGGIVFIAVISPVMLAVRSARNFASPDQMIALTFSAMSSGHLLATAQTLDKVREFYDVPYALHYTTGGGEVVQRFVNVEQMDIIVDRAHRFGQIGTARFWRGVFELLPSFVVPDKTVSKTPSYSLWVYGLAGWGLESNATETSFGDAYSFGGVNFVIYSMFGIFLFTFLLLRMFCPRLENSLFAAFILAATIQVLTETNTVGLLDFPVRQFPIELAIFWIATVVRQPLFSLFGPAEQGAKFGAGA